MNCRNMFDETICTVRHIISQRYSKYTPFNNKIHSSANRYRKENEITTNSEKNEHSHECLHARPDMQHESDAEKTRKLFGTVTV